LHESVACVEYRTREASRGEDFEVATLCLPSGKTVAVDVRRSPRARQILLHVDVYSGSVELVLPRRASEAEGLDFARAKRRWIDTRLREIAPAVPFVDGARFPFLGRDVRICCDRQLFDEVWHERDRLIVAGMEDGVSQRVESWLRAQARTTITARATEKARRIGQRYRHIRVRDPRTRWGSCARSGDLSFSWRLVMAPERVLDYVVAHEVAHLKVMNHSRRFWDEVERLCDDMNGSRAWLRVHGATLHRYGPPLRPGAG
jgi:predicted metal-dependent hydrolase